ncbi:MAG: hypothetical protein V4726_11085 [Verrucomicrobiota bacterium]
MSATTTEIDIRRLTGDTLSPLPVAAATKIPAGALVGVNASGHAINAADAASCKVVGVASETVDNTGSAGAKTILAPSGPHSGYANDGTNPCTIAHVGRTVYIKDNQTIQSATGTNSVKAGILMGINPDGTLRINIAPNH